MLTGWTRNPFRKGGSRPCDQREGLCTDEVPPAVAKAREKLAAAGISVVERSRSPVRQANSRMQGTHDSRTDQVSGHFENSKMKLILHSGEILTRARADGPWRPMEQQRRPIRGQAKLAERIAASSQMR